MNTLTIRVEGKKYEALVVFLTAHEIPFEHIEVETLLDRRLREADEALKNGELIDVDPQNVWKSLNI